MAENFMDSFKRANPYILLSTREGYQNIGYGAVPLDDIKLPEGYTMDANGFIRDNTNNVVYTYISQQHDYTLVEFLKFFTNKKIKNAKTKINKFATSVKTGVVQTYDSAKQTAKKVYKGAKKLVITPAIVAVGLGAMAFSGTVNGIKAVKSKATSLGNALYSAGQNFVEQAKAYTKATGKSIYNKLSTAYQKGKTAVKEAKDYTIELGKETLEDMKEIGGIMKEAGKEMAGAVVGAGMYAYEKGAQAADYVGQKIDQAGQYVYDSVQNAKEVVGAFTQNTQERLSNAWDDLTVKKINDNDYTIDAVNFMSENYKLAVDGYGQAIVLDAVGKEVDQIRHPNIVNRVMFSQIWKDAVEYSGIEKYSSGDQTPRINDAYNQICSRVGAQMQETGTFNPQEIRQYLNAQERDMFDYLCANEESIQTLYTWVSNGLSSQNQNEEELAQEQVAEEYYEPAYYEVQPLESGENMIENYNNESEYFKNIDRQDRKSGYPHSYERERGAS